MQIPAGLTSNRTWGRDSNQNMIMRVPHSRQSSRRVVILRNQPAPNEGTLHGAGIHNRCFPSGSFTHPSSMVAHETCQSPSERGLCASTSL